VPKGNFLSRFSTILFSSLHSLRLPLLSGRRRQVDCHLAAGRVLLAAGCLVGLWFDPGIAASCRTSVVTLAVCYFAASLGFFIWAVASASPVAGSLVTMHIIDVTWPPLVCLFASGFNTPAVVIILFAVMAAAYRWGFAETFASAAGSILLTALGRVIAATGVFAGLIPPPNSATSTFVAGAICLLLLGVVLGYLAEREKSFRARVLGVRQLVTNPSPEAGLRETLEHSLRTIASLAAAREVVLAVRDERTGKAFAWSLEGGDTPSATVQFAPLSALEHPLYFFDAPNHCWHLSARPRVGGSDVFSCLVVNAEGDRLPDEHFSLAGAFFLQASFRSLFAINFAIPTEWSGRLFLLDSKSKAHPSAELGFLQSLVWEALPTVYHLYVLQRLRSRVRAQERLRLAHEMHDGLLQSLISVEMQMDLLRRRSASDSQSVAQELRRLQQLLHHEILGARSLMEQLKLTEMSPQQMLNVMSEMVARFRRETGIAAALVCESEPVDLPPHVCREIACMLQEALTNVRKHSGARSVRVRFGMEAGCWKLVIADDGRGFEFSGRLSAIGPRAPRSAPAVLRERAQSIGADVEIESTPGQGARVEILLRPQELSV
jgi:signal transduction histidine kinase